MLLHALLLGIGAAAPAASPAFASASSLQLAAPPLLPPGARLRDLAAARTPPLLFGTDLVDSAPYPATGDPAACVGGNRSAPGCQPNASYAAIASQEFSAGNADFCLVWSSSQPTPAQRYDFTCAARIFVFMKKHKMAYAHVNAVMQAHNVAVWSPCCNPSWLTDGYPYSAWSRRNYTYNYTRAQARGFLQKRIAAVVPRWISSADIKAIIPINEAIANQPYTERGGWPHTWITGAEENMFSWAFGNSTHNSTAWFGQTFKWVRAAADGAGASKLKLFYNDYGIETPGAKQDAVLRLLTEQKAAGVPIDGIGFQSHLPCDCAGVAGCNSSAVIAASMRRFVKAGFKVAVTELDVKTAPGCTPAMQAAVYGAVLKACLSVSPHCEAFMVWGFTDHIWSPTQWLAGKKPAIFDGDYHAKESYFTLQKILAAKTDDVAVPVVTLGTSLATEPESGGGVVLVDLRDLARAAAACGVGTYGSGGSCANCTTGRTTPGMIYGGA